MKHLSWRPVEPWQREWWVKTAEGRVAFPSGMPNLGRLGSLTCDGAQSQRWWSWWNAGLTTVYEEPTICCELSSMLGDRWTIPTLHAEQKHNGHYWSLCFQTGVLRRSDFPQGRMGSKSSILFWKPGRLAPLESGLFTTPLGTWWWRK